MGLNPRQRRNRARFREKQARLGAVAESLARDQVAFESIDCQHVPLRYSGTQTAPLQIGDYVPKGRPRLSRSGLIINYALSRRNGREVRLEEEITKKRPPNEEEKNDLSPRQCTVSQIDRHNGKIAQITL